MHHDDAEGILSAEPRNDKEIVMDRSRELLASESHDDGQPAK
jgi:hypothetical protein